MTKAFLPLFKHQAITDAHPFSQIVNIVSVAGMTSAGGLAASAYEGSKHACEAFTNALRLEMKMFGIRVVALNPSFFDTPMTTNVKQRFLAHVTAKSMSQTRKDYGDGMYCMNTHLFISFDYSPQQLSLLFSTLQNRVFSPLRRSL